MMNKTEQVNHPQHYNGRKDGIECIEVIRHYQYNIGAAIKYLWRAGLKHSKGKTDREKEIEDLKKAKWYIEDYRGRPTRLGGVIKIRLIDDIIIDTTGYSVSQITAPYSKHVRDAMEFIMRVGVINRKGEVCQSFLWDKLLIDAIESIECRISELNRTGGQAPCVK